MLSAQHVADAEIGFKGHGHDDGAAGHARQFADGGAGVVEMLQHFQAGDGVKAAGGEGQREHRGADAVRLDRLRPGSVGRRSRQTGRTARGQHAAAEHLALAAAGVEDGMGIELREDGAQAEEESPDDETDDRVFVGVLFLADHDTPAPSVRELALPGGGAEAQHVADVLQGVQGVDLALAADALAHLVAALVDFAHVAADQEFHQALIAERLERHAGDGFAAHQVAAAQGVRNAGVDLGQQPAADLGGAPGTDAAGQSPIAQSAAIAVAGGHHQIGAGAGAPAGGPGRPADAGNRH